MRTMKKMVALVMAMTMVVGSNMTVFAAGWQQNTTGWRWQNDDGSWHANGWQWLDGNGDGVAECYYFNGDGYMLANTTTPDGYTVNADGAWSVNGEIQTKQVETGAGNPGGNTSERFVESDALPNIIMPTNGFQGTYSLTREMFEGFKAQSPDANPSYVQYGNSSDKCYYTYNNEKFTLGKHLPGDLIQKSGKWVIDTSKQDAMNGKTNIRFMYDDGSFAGLGFHSMSIGKNAPRFSSVFETQETTLYLGNGQRYFSEDGYLMRNCYIQNEYDELPNKIGCNGGWVDRNY